METVTVPEFCSKNKITLDYQEVDSRPDNLMSDSMNHYKCVLKSGLKRMTLYFSMGSACNIPTVEDVLNSLVMDCGQTEENFESWVDNFGYDSDSIKALKIYKAVKHEEKRLKKFLGEELFKEAMHLEGL